MNLTHKESKEICKLGEGSKCCAFLTMGTGGFECGRKDAQIFMATVERLKEGSMNAKGEGMWEGCKCLKKN